MKLGLTGKVALITGGSKGLGFGIAEALAREGAKIVITARSEDGLSAAAAHLQGLGCEVEVVKVDALDRTCGDIAVKAAVRRFGTVHILVNNAGGLKRLATFDELTDEDWYWAFEFNLLSAVRMTRAALPWMRQQKWGRIINVASEAALQPDPGICDYNATKAALLNLSKSLSKALAADGILVNSITPGTIRTPLLYGFLQEMAEARGCSVDAAEEQHLRESRPNVVLRRSGEACEVGAAVAFLASESASFITGSNLRIDGGSVASV